MGARGNSVGTQWEYGGSMVGVWWELIGSSYGAGTELVGLKYGDLVNFFTTKDTKVFTKDVCLPLRTRRFTLRFTKVLLDVLDSLPLRTRRFSLSALRLYDGVVFLYH